MNNFLFFRMDVHHYLFTFIFLTTLILLLINNLEFINVVPVKAINLIYDGSLDKNQSMKIVSLNLQAGYGNHLYSILTSMTIALLSNRKLQMIWPDIEPFIVEPSKNAFIKNSNNKHYLINPKENSGYKLIKNIPTILSTNISFTDEIVFFDKGIAYFMEICSNPGYYKKLVNLNLTQISTVEHALKLIRMNASHDDLIDGIYKIGNFFNSFNLFVLHNTTTIHAIESFFFTYFSTFSKI